MNKVLGRAGVGLVIAVLTCAAWPQARPGSGLNTAWGGNYRSATDMLAKIDGEQQVIACGWTTIAGAIPAKRSRRAPTSSIASLPSGEIGVGRCSATGRFASPLQLPDPLCPTANDTGGELVAAQDQPGFIGMDPMGIMRRRVRPAR